MIIPDLKLKDKTYEMSVSNEKFNYIRYVPINYKDNIIGLIEIASDDEVFILRCLGTEDKQ